jgi:hypothetical protein
MRPAGRAGWLATACVLAIACAESRPDPTPAAVERPAAIVGGVPISIGDVRAEMKAGGGSPEEALERVIRRELLLAYARDHGISTHAPDRAERRTMVRELLARTVEAEVTADGIREEDVRAAFEAQHDRFRQPEKRTALHFLAELDESSTPAEVDAAFALARSVLAEAIVAPDPGAVFNARAENLERVRVEDLGTFDRNANFVEEFREPVFAAPAIGVMPEPVRSEFGVHVVWIIRIVPADDMPYELVAPMLRRELLIARRAEALTELESRLAAGAGVEVDETLLRSLPDDFEQGER